MSFYTAMWAPKVQISLGGPWRRSHCRKKFWFWRSRSLCASLIYRILGASRHFPHSEFKIAENVWLLSRSPLLMASCFQSPPPPPPPTAVSKSPKWRHKVPVFERKHYLTVNSPTRTRRFTLRASTVCAVVMQVIKAVFLNKWAVSVELVCN